MSMFGRGSVVSEGLLQKIAHFVQYTVCTQVAEVISGAYIQEFMIVLCHLCFTLCFSLFSI